MPNAVRDGDICLGHSCFPPRKNTQSSPDVIINGRGVHREGDAWATHTCDSSHAGVLAAGSATVITNGKQTARVGDPVNCGSKAGGTFSPDVIIGE